MVKITLFVKQTIKHIYSVLPTIHCILTVLSYTANCMCLVTKQAGSISVVLTDITTAIEIIRGWYGI